MSSYGANIYREATGLSWIPDNMAEYLATYYTNVQYDICNTDAECGYGYRFTKRIKIFRPFEKCTRCCYHSLFNPDDTESPCRRHNLIRGWEEIFSAVFKNEKDLETFFDIFLKHQPEIYIGKVIPMSFAGG